MIKRIWSETDEFIGGDLKSRTIGFLFGHYVSLMFSSFAMYFIQKNLLNHYVYGLKELVLFILFGPFIQVALIFIMWFFAARPAAKQYKNSN